MIPTLGGVIPTLGCVMIPTLGCVMPTLVGVIPTLGGGEVRLWHGARRWGGGLPVRAAIWI